MEPFTERAGPWRLSTVPSAGTLLSRTAALLPCTFNSNIAQETQGGEALAVHQADAVSTNCIFWHHAATAQSQIALVGTTERNAHLEISYCNVLAGIEGTSRQGAATITWGNGNLDANPLFQNPAGNDDVAGTEDDDLRIRSGSSCIDAGDNTAVPADADDLDGNNDRLERIPLDLGGQSRFADDSNAANTGVADSPAYPWIVDIGAYEFTR